MQKFRDFGLAIADAHGRMELLGQALRIRKPAAQPRQLSMLDATPDSTVLNSEHQPTLPSTSHAGVTSPCSRAQHLSKFYGLSGRHQLLPAHVLMKQSELSFRLDFLVLRREWGNGSL